MMKHEDARVTVGKMVSILQEYPETFLLDFSPGNQEDVTNAFIVEVLEGTTPDCPGTVWIELRNPVKPWFPLQRYVVFHLPVVATSDDCLEAYSVMANGSARAKEQFCADEAHEGRRIAYVTVEVS